MSAEILLTKGSMVSSTLTLIKGSVPLYHIAISISDPSFTTPSAEEPKIWAKGISGKFLSIADAISDILTK